jgi:menaquinone-dependent protoporphyrinogen oxidase
MSSNVLIAYASKYGSTAEIAEKIGEVLRREGLQVDVFPVKDVKDIGPYHAVILGSAVYMGFWRKEAVKFLRNNEKALSERVVWLFSSGPSGEGDPVELLKGWRLPPGQQPIVDRIKPRDITVFHGNLDVKKLNPFEKWIINRVKAQTGDFRNWDAITAWASSVADALNKAV